MPSIMMVSTLGGVAWSAPPPSTTVVDVQSATVATQVAVLACAGLFNRDDTVAGAAYTLGADGQRDKDIAWYNDTVGPLPELTPSDDFLDACLRKVAKGYLRYNASTDQEVLPNIITMAGVLDAVPLEVAPSFAAPMVFDASATWANATALLATQWVYERYVNQTTGMAKLNPGFDVHGQHKLRPPLTRRPNVQLTDYIVQQRLFNFFLPLGCVPLTAEHALVKQIVGTNPWTKPIAVYGYDDSVALAGDLFEAETNCVAQHNLGQIASLVSNLAFFSRAAAIDAPGELAPNPEPPAPHLNRSRTYLSIVIGDGDNVGFVKGSRRDWIEQRIAKCAGTAGGAATGTATGTATLCFPLAWTISPAALHLAPDWLRWYFAQARSTRRDWFVLPPSGHLYAYPAMMPGDVQEAFAAATERDAALLGTNTSVSWDFAGYWEAALRNYLPRYSGRGGPRGFFAVNVPYLLPTAPFALTDATYKIVGAAKDVVLFKPREWRGGSGGNAATRKFFLPAAEMAAEVSAYPLGSVAHLYVTSDGGANLDLVYEMVAKLAPHVELVSPNGLVAMALQRG